jgi:hypothetical protein
MAIFATGVSSVNCRSAHWDGVALGVGVAADVAVVVGLGAGLADTTDVGVVLVEAAGLPVPHAASKSTTTLIAVRRIEALTFAALTL